MFTAKLWQFSKKENSTKRPSDSDATMVDCETNNDFDLLNPVFVFSFRGGAIPRSIITVMWELLNGITGSLVGLLATVSG